MSEDTSWVFDSLVCFLHGPVWNAPLQNFIEEKCYVFDPNQKCDERSPIYKKIFEEYKELVDYMLGSFMEEMQITPEQFEIACLEGRHQQPDNSFNFHQGLFQQIWAANDIRIFIRMMTQRNVELQLQALDLIERKQNPSETTKTEDVLKDIPEEFIQEKIQAEVDVSKLVQEKLNISKNDDKVHETIGEDKFERLNLFFKNKEINPEDVQARQEYLRSQRDKILEIKKKVRAKQLNETTKLNADGSSGTGGRPSSAQAARKILEGNHVKEVAQDSVTNAASELRKALAKRLKVEVVDQQN